MAFVSVYFPSVSVGGRGGLFVACRRGQLVLECWHGGGVICGVPTPLTPLEGDKTTVRRPLRRAQTSIHSSLPANAKKVTAQNNANNPHVVGPKRRGHVRAGGVYIMWCANIEERYG